MMRFIEKVGNIAVYLERNAKDDYTVNFLNGVDVVERKRYKTENPHGAICDLFRHMDIFTLPWLQFQLEELQEVKPGLFRSYGDYFKRIDDTDFYKHFDHEPMMAA